MEVSIDPDGAAVITVSTPELHVLHSALHQYGEHQLSEALRTGEGQMGDSFREQLSRARDLAVDMGKTLSVPCAQSGHGTSG